jgi:hypothetical protein
VALHPSQRLLGHRPIDPPTRALHRTRRHLATVHSPVERLRVADARPDVATE